jgi:hypothetical protein
MGKRPCLFARDRGQLGCLGCYVAHDRPGLHGQGVDHPLQLGEHLLSARRAPLVMRRIFVRRGGGGGILGVIDLWADWMARLFVVAHLRILVPKVAHTGEEHGRAGGVGGGDDRRIAL